jgi:DNA modification methylase
MTEIAGPVQPPLLTGDDFGGPANGSGRPTKRSRGRALTGRHSAGGSNGDAPGVPDGATPRPTKHPRNSLNELSGDAWIFFTKSVVTTAYASEFGHELRKAHGANKPPQLMRSLIEFFTPAGGRVLDPFAGVGGTLIGAAICESPRECTGIEINQQWVDVYRQVLAKHPELNGGEIHLGDSMSLLRDSTLFPDESFDFICTDPPYNVHLAQTMSNDERYAHNNRKTDYNMRSESPEDLANLPSYDAFLDAMQSVMRGCFRVLKSGKYLAVILRNAYQDGRYIFTHVDVARRAEAEGFITKGEQVWYQAGTRLRPYGYPFAYIPNIAHQHIVFLQKPRRGK